VKHYGFLSHRAEAMDRFGQEFRTLIPPTGFFGAWTQVNEVPGGGLPIIVMAVWQDFEDCSPSAQKHERFIHDDGSQPGSESRRFLKAPEMKKALMKTLLRHIFGIFPVVRYP
jgi:hypothetical protein